MSNDSQMETKSRGARSAPLSYRETIYQPIWIAVPLVLFAALCAGLYFGLRGDVSQGAQTLLWAWDVIWVPSLVCILLVPIFLGRFVVVVERGALIVRFGFVSFSRDGGKKIPLKFIARAEAVSYEPIRQFGGWGVRAGTYDGARTAVYSLGGSKGVLLTLKIPIDTLFARTDKILIGNRDCDRLADYLTRVI